MNIARYLKIANYLRKRYTQAGRLIVQQGRFMSLPAALDEAGLATLTGPKPAVTSRADTIIELRTIYRLIDQQLYAAAKSKLILLGRNLQS